MLNPRTMLMIPSINRTVERHSIIQGAKSTTKVSRENSQKAVHNVVRIFAFIG